MKKLSRSEMKIVMGGLIPGEGCAACGATCSINQAPAYRICCPGGDCKDQGEERGSICT